MKRKRCKASKQSQQIDRDAKTETDKESERDKGYLCVRTNGESANAHGK